MRVVPVPKKLREKDWVLGTRVYSAPDGDLTSTSIPPAEGILYMSHVEGFEGAVPMVGAVLRLEEDEVAAIQNGCRHILLSWVGTRMPVFIVPDVIKEDLSSGWNYEVSRSDRLRDLCWEDCRSCGGTGEDRSEEGYYIGICPDCVDGLAPPDGMVEAAAKAMEQLAPNAPLRFRWYTMARAALVAAARWEGQ